MRIVKARLLEMVPDFSIFLDVDDLEDISDLEGYIDRTVTILVFCSKGYFQSKNCMRELRSSTAKGKPMIAVLDPDSTSGHLTVDDIGRELTVAETEHFAAWGFEGDGGPSAQECYEALLAQPPVEWNRIGAFQVAERAGCPRL